HERQKQKREHPRGQRSEWKVEIARIERKTQRRLKRHDGCCHQEDDERKRQWTSPAEAACRSRPPEEIRKSCDSDLRANRCSTDQRSADSNADQYRRSQNPAPSEALQKSI